MNMCTYADALQWLEDMRDYALKARTNAGKRPMSDMEADEPYLFTVLYPLQVVGEAATHIPRPVRALEPQIPWDLIVGFRHVAVHGYGAIRVDRVYSIVHDELDTLIAHLSGLIPRVESLGETPLPPPPSTPPH